MSRARRPPRSRTRGFLCRRSGAAPPTPSLPPVRPSPPAMTTRSSSSPRTRPWSSRARSQPCGRVWRKAPPSSRRNYQAADPTGYGRLLVDGGDLVAIREHKDATPAERAVRLCNAGLMALDGRKALALLDSIGDDNAQKEFYLTDAVAMARAQGAAAVALVAPETEVMGVNDRVQLAAAAALWQARRREAVMREGATLVDPATNWCHMTPSSAATCWLNRMSSSAPASRGGRRGHPRLFASRGRACRPRRRHRPLRPPASGRETGREGARIGNFVEIKNADVAWRQDQPSVLCRRRHGLGT